jgi:pyruvate/2-oxoglutarate dehydrogenase complex dihydrolipoamide dehydrogenase (E3) component
MAEVPDEVDVIVLGMGPGGEEVANALVARGMAVVALEPHLVGGECPYYACIPTKTMVRAAEVLAEARRVAQLAGAADVRPDWAPLAARVREVTADWDDTAAAERFTAKGGHLLRAAGVLDGPGRVRVGDRVLRARRGVVLATGTAPQLPSIDGLDQVPYWTNRDAVKAERAPGSLVVLGGGPVGSELAQVFTRFGTRVTLIQHGDRLLPKEEPEAGEVVADVFRREGIDVRFGVRATAVAAEGDGVRLELDDGSAVPAERLLVATGRRPNLAGIGLDTVGLDDGGRSVPVDDHMRVADGLWAVGDITGHGPFTHVATYQAGIAVADITGKEPRAAEYAAENWVTFTDPEVGRAGMTEQEARDAGLVVRVGRTDVPSTSRGYVHGPGNDGFLKLVADGERDVLVGATSVGPRGGEVLSMLTLAVHAQVPLERLRSMIYAFPTFHRGVLAAVDDLDG